MADAKKIYKQISDITAELIRMGLCDDQNFPSMGINHEGNAVIGFKGGSSVALKNILYHELYKILLIERQYNLKMLDGALIGLQYCVSGKELLGHRLTFFPAPNLEEYQNDPETYINDELYSEIVDRKIVKTPLRFDFDAGDAFISVRHPMSHFTIGQYENCRIPVTSALTPYQFIDFILRNFYNTGRYSGMGKAEEFKFETTITKAEKEIVHLCVP